MLCAPFFQSNRRIAQLVVQRTERVYLRPGTCPCLLHRVEISIILWPNVLKPEQLERFDRAARLEK
jgi:hypothetical protein